MGKAKAEIKQWTQNLTHEDKLDVTMIFKREDGKKMSSARKIRSEELGRRAQIARRGFREWFERVKEDLDSVPDKTVTFTWSEEELTEIFTKERLRLFRKVKKGTYDSVKKLAEELGRDESRVRKNLKILEEYGLVELARKGRNIEVKSDVQAIYIPVEGVPIGELEKVTT